MIRSPFFVAFDPNENNYAVVCLGCKPMFNMPNSHKYTILSTFTKESGANKMADALNETFAKTETNNE
jgi:hypothetical protein